jgi:hypothetical protein
MIWAKHLPSDKREINRRPFRFIADSSGREVPVIHSKFGGKNHKAYVNRQQ